MKRIKCDITTQHCDGIWGTEDREARSKLKTVTMMPLRWMNGHVLHREAAWVHPGIESQYSFTSASSQAYL
ncbi:hypothetical protein EYF80_052881 [Liparis tanakae]|uniref:Uncharacterized protein n=1 Tax=Liparis tanakae TaxID=230148 RepID=A0A4Z2F743_9TELE|nr:hypothetical protein EYF80_052881 [Liparis tanakae]